MNPSSKSRIAGWIISGLIAALLMGPSAIGKFVDWEGKPEMLAKMGFTESTLFKIGVLEVGIALLFLFPRTAFIGTILLTAYLGGAVVTHLRVDEPIAFPIILGILAWFGYGFRQPALFRLIGS